MGENGFLQQIQVSDPLIPQFCLPSRIVSSTCSINFSLPCAIRQRWHWADSGRTSPESWFRSRVPRSLTSSPHRASFYHFYLDKALSPLLAFINKREINQRDVYGG